MKVLKYAFDYVLQIIIPLIILCTKGGLLTFSFTFFKSPATYYQYETR